VTMLRNMPSPYLPPLSTILTKSGAGDEPALFFTCYLLLNIIEQFRIKPAPELGQALSFVSGICAVWGMWGSWPAAALPGLQVSSGLAGA